MEFTFLKIKTQALGRLEHAFKVIKGAEAIEKKVRKAVASKALPKQKGAGLFVSAMEKGIITKDELAQLQTGRRAA